MCSLLQTFKITGKQVDVAELFSCVRSFATDQGMRKQGIGSGGAGGGQGTKCAFCGKAGHVEANCYAKKSQKSEPSASINFAKGTQKLPSISECFGLSMEAPDHSHQLINFIDLANSNAPQLPPAPAPPVPGPALAPVSQPAPTPPPLVDVDV